MSCNICNPLLEVDERKIPVDRKNVFDEYWYIDFTENNCKIVVDYDCGYAKQCIEYINYCPMCGRKLSDE